VVQSGSRRHKGAQSAVILVCWPIWRERNPRVFEGKEKPVHTVLAEIKEEALLWRRAGAKGIADLVARIVSE
jgi:hypothetical protein